MASLPDDIWHKILQIGIETNRSDHTDLCSLAIVNSHFDQLTQDPALWDRLFSRDFPFSFYYIFRAPAPSKDLYRKEYEREQFWLRLHRPEEPLPALDFLPLRLSITGPLSRNQSRIQDLGLGTNAANVIVGHFADINSSFIEEGGSANRPVLTKAKKQYYEKKPKRFDKSSRPKAIPNSKSYVPMNRPPRRSMPRRI